MRQIKFRGKSWENDTWLYGDLIQAIDHERKAIVPQIFGYFDYSDYEINTKTVGQFAGLYDYEGKEIWEGDIMNDTIRTYEVVWHDGMFMFQFWNETTQRYLLTGIDLRNSKVIGNKFDNPELLSSEPESNES
jgi:hypothetical protein